jgi:hypothetical protein
MDDDNSRSCLRSSFGRKKFRWFTACAGAVLTFGAASFSEAALVSRLNGAAVYDTDLDVTWLADANLAASNTFGVAGIATGTNAGRMNWNTAQTWLAAMNAADYLGISNWRLPLTVAPDPTCSSSQTNAVGNNCTGSEMGHLFYNELGGTAGSSILTSADPDLALFQNIVANYYWSTDYTPSPGAIYAWEFSFATGQQVGVIKSVTDYVWVVRTGDVVVPLPATFWLLGSGLMGLAGLSWKNRTNAK